MKRSLSLQATRGGQASATKSMGQRLELGMIARGTQCFAALRYLVSRCGWSSHDDEARQFQVLDEVLGSDPGHQLIALMKLFPLVESESVGERLREVIGGSPG
jgi:hypothetical protein